MASPLQALTRIGHEMARFGVVGLLGLAVDLGLFNALRYWGGEGVLYDKPLTAKAISVVVATMVTFAGNRHWAFRHRGQRGVVSGYALFFLLNGIGMAIALACLFISHYVMGLTSPLADNISANGVGLVLGTLFRFWSYRRWVFPHPSPHVRDIAGTDDDIAVAGSHDQ